MKYVVQGGHIKRKEPQDPVTPPSRPTNEGSHENHQRQQDMPALLKPMEGSRLPWRQVGCTPQPVHSRSEIEDELLGRKCLVLFDSIVIEQLVAIYLSLCLY